MALALVQLLVKVLSAVSHHGRSQWWGHISVWKTNKNEDREKKETD